MRNPGKESKFRTFNTIQRANCLAILPETWEGDRVPDGTIVDCVLLDAEEGMVL